MAAIELYEAMRTLRAVRRLRPDPIPNDVLRRVLEAATWAPTGGNRPCLACRCGQRRAAQTTSG
jgi:nitroreductase